MAVAFDAVGPSIGTSVTGTTTNMTWSHTCTGSNLVLIVAVALGNSTSIPAITSITFNSVGMTAIGSKDVPTLGGRIWLYALVNPTTGANTVSVTRAAGSGTTMIGGSVSFTGASQTIGNYTNFAVANGSGTSASVTCVAPAATSQVIDGICTGSAVGTATRTNRWKKNVNTTTGGGNAASSTTAGTGSNVAMGYSITSDEYAMIALEVPQVVVATTAQEPTNINQAVKMASFI